MGLKKRLKEVEGLKTESVMIEEWGFEVELREPTAGEAVRYSKKVAQMMKEDGVDTDSSAAWEMLSLCVFEGGERVFADAAEAEDALGDKGFGPVSKLTKVCQKMLGIDVDAALKNFLETQDGSSSSA